MFQNYLKIALRNLLKNKTFSIINILGLSVGIACALLIIFHVKKELSYDKDFSKADRIFRITNQGLGEDNRHWAATPPLLGPAMAADFPEIERVVRFHRLYPYQVFSYTPLEGEVKRFEEKGGFFADSGVVDLFDIQFSQGNPKTALSGVDAIVITEQMARKYFGNQNPLGKTIQDDRNKLPLRITGVVKAFAFPTHLKFDYLLSMGTITKYMDQQSLENRKWSGFYNYVLLKEKDSSEAIAAKMSEFMVKFYLPTGDSREKILANRKLNLQPVTDIHLHSKLEKEMYPNSDITYVYIFSVVAIFILLIASVNFINISTSQAFNRMKEIGLRKVVGATRHQLIRQFLGESFLITLLSAVLALLLFRLAMPFYEALTSQRFQFSEILVPVNIGMLLVLIVSVGLLAGLYPAWFVAHFNPVTSLKGKKLSGSPVHLIRKGLIVFQFVVSVFMIFSTVIIYRQMEMFHNQDLGFDKEQVVAVTMYDNMWPKYGALVDEIEQNPDIASHSVVSTLPGERFGMYSFAPLSGPDSKDLPESSRLMWADENLLTTLKIKLKEGRQFFNQMPDVKKHEFILNETAVKTFKLTDPIGRKVVVNGDTGEVAGVAKDFNFASLHDDIEPLVIQYSPYRTSYLLVKVKADRLKKTLAFMESSVKSLSPSSNFSYSFIDDRLNQLYDSENRMSQVFKAFAAFAILISCIGLFGLSAYSASLRIKEVGVRKVLGASTGNVAVLLSKDFIKLVAIAILISLPLSWWVMSQWLSGFAYRIHMDVSIFVISGISALLVALFTVSFQAIKTALSDPAKTLKTE